MDPYIALAKKTIETYLKSGQMIESGTDLDKQLLNERKGVFICFKNKGELRGCIGTFLPVYDNVAEEIINNTIAAASEDPRFLPITVEELKELKITIDLLSEPEKVADNKIKSLDPKKYGIVVKSVDGFKSGLLLPDLEGVDTVAEQLRITCQKAGLDPDKEKIVVYKFTVSRHEEK